MAGNGRLNQVAKELGDRLKFFQPPSIKPDPKYYPNLRDLLEQA